ncbi:MAG TPA: VOC family protein [Dehalococcoidia bacterium]|nr:VOC family protein [Dehalococcoidia bacterium]
MTRPTDLFCVLRYENAPAAIDWLEKAFGFTREFVVPGDDGEIAFAALRLGDDVLGTGTVRPDVKHAICVYVEDPDAHCARARAQGVEITQDVSEEEHGRIYVCKDLDGHVWSFGTTFLKESPGCDLFPVVGYKDTEAAIRFLKDAFGIEERMLVRNEDGSIGHSELGIGYGVIMPTHSNQPGDNPWAQIDFGVYVCVDDPAAHYERAKAAGAEIVRDLKAEDYGASTYSARDCEGNLWSFGDYRPEGSRP